MSATPEDMGRKKLKGKQRNNEENQGSVSSSLTDPNSKWNSTAQPLHLVRRGEFKE
jgi:hypothetical protein